MTKKTKKREKFSRICKSETIITEILYCPLSCSPTLNNNKAILKFSLCKQWRNKKFLPSTQLAEPSRVVNEEQWPAVGREGEVHVVNGRLEVAEVAVFGEREELGARRHRHTREELVRVVLALLHDQLALDLLELAQQHQARHHVRRHDVEVAEEVAQQTRYVCERVLPEERLKGCGRE